MRSVYAIFLVLVISSCNNEPGNSHAPINTAAGRKTNEAAPAAAANTVASVGGCYRLILKRDTFVVRLQQQHTTVSGHITFDNFEKDGSSGPVHGTVTGNLVRVLYSFASEGMNSVMELYFKKVPGGLVRGIGPMTNRGDTSYFVNAAQIEYPENEGLFKKQACSDLPAKYP